MSKLNLKFTARDVAAVEEALDGSLEKIIESFKIIYRIKSSGFFNYLQNLST